MSLVISKVFTYDTDAGNYIQAVEAADGQVLEGATRKAINNFVIGCKQDGIWSAIKASCILAGARTLAGALVPLVGTAPTNNNFVSSDYNRKTGLVGNATTKYLDSNAKLSTTCPFNNAHVSIYASTAASTGKGYIGNDDVTSNTGEIGLYRDAGVLNGRFQSVLPFTSSASPSSAGFIGIARSNGTSLSFRASLKTELLSYSSAGSSSATSNVAVFSRDLVNASSRSNPRLAFYSIGESLDLTLLDARVTALITAFGAAIP